MLALVVLQLLSRLAFSMMRVVLLGWVVAFLVGWDTPLESFARLLLVDLVLQIFSDLWVPEQFFQLRNGYILA